MTRKLDPDIKALRACKRALDKSSSPRMAKVNAGYLYGYYSDEATKLQKAYEVVMPELKKGREAIKNANKTK